MAIEKVQEVLIEALRQAAAEPGEQRLFRSGKLEGLFPSKAGINAEAAARAIRDQFLEVVRTETKGKTVVEWVRVTPQGVHFLHEQESPRRVLEDLRLVLQTNQAQVPLWIADLRQQTMSLTQKLVEEAQRWTHRLEMLSQRVDEALRRAEAADAKIVEEGANSAWAAEALSYLEKRPGECPLPELFAAVRHGHPDLSIAEFHDGLRRLRQRQSLKLLPHTGDPAALAEPEFALLDGAELLYYAAR